MGSPLGLDKATRLAKPSMVFVLEGSIPHLILILKELIMKILLFFLGFLLHASTTQAQNTAIDECIEAHSEPFERDTTGPDCIIHLCTFMLSQPLPTWIAFTEINHESLDTPTPAVVKTNDAFSIIDYWADRQGYNWWEWSALFAELFEANEMLITVYEIAYAQAVAEQVADRKERAMQLFVSYIGNKDNEVKRDKSIRKLLKAGKKGDYQAYF